MTTPSANHVYLGQNADVCASYIWGLSTSYGKTHSQEWGIAVIRDYHGLLFIIVANKEALVLSNKKTK